MLFTTLVLVTVQREHDGLQQCVNLWKADKSAQRCNMSGLALEYEKEVAVQLHSTIIGKRIAVFDAMFFQMRSHFILLQPNVCVSIQQSMLIRGTKSHLPRPAQFGFESREQYENPNNAHPSPTQSSFSTGQRSWISNHVNFFELVYVYIRPCVNKAICVV